MIRYIKRLVPKEVYINDPHLPVNIIDNNETFNNYSIEEVLDKSDIVFIAMNHSEYSNINKQKFDGKIVVDIWGILGGTIVNDFR
jgi:UDP-N-acetyl-D-mannosaminuronate dehydrogenase